MKRVLLSFLFMALCVAPLFSQKKEEADSLIRLLNAQKAKLIDIDGKPFRKIEGPAKFFHNNTQLLCDTALWNVDEGYIDAIGNIKIIQDNTTLTGDRIHYIIEEDLAQFRGSMVELVDKENNTLRTKHLDYNTKDSIAIFSDGASMKDKDGNIIESIFGKYESKLSLFTFIGKVQMFSDSLFFVSDTIKYRSDLETAFFARNTRGWKDENYLSSDGGWYNRGNETLFFNKRVYAQTHDYEVWCDDVYYERNTEYALLKKDIQLLDTLNGAIIMGDRLIYHNNPRSALVLDDPVFAAIVDDNGEKDTVFISGDTLKYYDLRRCDIDSATIAAAKERISLSEVDAIKNIKDNMRIAAEQAAKSNQGGASKPKFGKVPKDGGEGGRSSAAEGLNSSKSESMNQGEKSILSKKGSAPPVQVDIPTPGDTLSSGNDSIPALRDTIPKMDTIPSVLDTTHISFLEAYHNVKIYKSDMQGLCDSLLYSDLDSMARLFIHPVLWNEVKNQLASDSMQVVVKDGQMKKGLLLSEAFLITNEGNDYYNQVKSPEMVGYFEEGELVRFDALGGASMIFYLQEDTVITTMNQKECKIISSILKNGELKKNYYYEGIKSNAYPIYDLSEDLKKLKGFNWRGEERPESRFDLTSRKINNSMRHETIETPFFPQFKFTSTFFPDYMEGVMNEINIRKPLKWKYIEVSEEDKKEVYIKKGKRPFKIITE